MARVFISHAQEDLACAVEIRDWIRADGHEVFLDRDLQDGTQPGENLVERLFDELHRAHAVVAIVTEAFVSAPWCSVEVGAALARGCLLLPLQVEDGVVHPAMINVVYGEYSTDPDGTRQRVIQALRLLDGGGVVWQEGENPYPGLKPFDSGLAPMFFGRRREARELAEKIRSGARDGRLLAVVGPSGCGKSSLLGAGVVPLLSAAVRTCPLAL